MCGAAFASAGYKKKGKNMKHTFAEYFSDTILESVSEALVKLEKEDSDYREFLREKESFADKLRKEIRDPERIDRWEDMQYQQLFLEENAIYRQAFHDVMYLLFRMAKPV